MKCDLLERAAVAYDAMPFTVVEEPNIVVES
jgi:hypothetical protein